MSSPLERLRDQDKGEARRKILVVVIVAVVLVIVFSLSPLILDIIWGDEGRQPSEQLHGTMPLISFILLFYIFQVLKSSFLTPLFGLVSFKWPINFKK